MVAVWVLLLHRGFCCDTIAESFLPSVHYPEGPLRDGSTRVVGLILDPLGRLRRTLHHPILA